MKQCKMSIACDAIKKIDCLEDMDIIRRQFNLTMKSLKAQKALESKAKFSVGDKITIAPGRRIKVGNKTRWEPLETHIESIKGGGLNLDTANAGGLCGIATPLDPVTTKADELSGQVMAKQGELPPIWETLELDLELLEKMVAGGDGDSDSVRPLSMNEMLMINSATATSVGTVTKKGKISKISLRLPICAKVGSRITLSRRVGSRWRLIGHGTIVG